MIMSQSIKTQLMGIVNITDDSFSDGGKYLNTDKAINHALQLYKEGADIIDLGAASSNIHSGSVSEEVEISRLTPVIEELKSKKIPISIDTFKPAIQKVCLKLKVDYLNDIQGFPYPEIYSDLSAAKDCKLIAMHSMQRIGTATIMETEPKAVFNAMITFFEQRINKLHKAGIENERLIVDPGMGFFLGSDPTVSTYMLKNLNLIADKFKLPILIGISRKSFLSKISGCNKSDCAAATLAAELYAARNGANIIRTHEVKQLQQGLSIQNALE